jgi:DNA-binding IclR family transcriptional regulator
VPIFDYLGHVVAALTMPYVPQRAATVPLETARDLVVEAGRAISIDLGAGSRDRAAPPATRRKA